MAKSRPLEAVTKLALALPDAERKMTGPHAAFRVARKTFAYYLEDHHGDGEVAVVCKGAPGQNTMLVEADPVTFFMPAYLASRGWVAMRLDARRVKWTLARELVEQSYALVAPRRLSATSSGKKKRLGR